MLVQVYKYTRVYKYTCSSQRQDISRVDHLWQVHQRAASNTASGTSIFSRRPIWSREHFDSWFPILPTYVRVHLIRLHTTCNDISANRRWSIQTDVLYGRLDGNIYRGDIWQLDLATLALLDFFLIHWCVALFQDRCSLHIPSRNPRLWLVDCPPVLGFSLVESAAAVADGGGLQP